MTCSSRDNRAHSLARLGFSNVTLVRKALNMRYVVPILSVCRVFLHWNYVCTLIYPPHLALQYLWRHRLAVQLCCAYGRSPGVLQPFGYSQSLNPPAESNWLLKKKKQKARGKLDRDVNETCKHTAHKCQNGWVGPITVAMEMRDKQIVPSMLNCPWGKNRAEKETSCITSRDLKLASI